MSDKTSFGEPQTPPFPVIYKYTNQVGAEKILSTRTLRFARPSEMNDPFDVDSDDFFGAEEDFADTTGNAFMEAFLDRPDLLPGTGEDKEEIVRKLEGFPESEKQKFRRFFKAQDWKAQVPGQFRELLKKVQEASKNDFIRCGIFCATRTYSNLLMWAHYADRHQGAVLGFRTDLPDSILGQIEAVTYSGERPYLYKPDKDWLQESFTRPDMAVVKEAYQRLILTKSLEWSYEQECRLLIPNKVQEGQAAYFVSYYPSELVRTFFGAKMDEDTKVRFARLARTINPDVEIYSTKLVRRKYALEFTPFPCQS